MLALPVRVGGRELRASGSFDLVAFRPQQMKLRINGELNASLLRLLLPEQFSEAAGAAAVQLQLEGPVSDPQVKGQLRVLRIAITPRGLPRIAIRQPRIASVNLESETREPL